jgi:murein DD-endopeptidase / murein LD-carboxypeptidase
MKRGIKVAILLLSLLCVGSQYTSAQFSKSKNRKYKLPDLPEKEVFKDKGVLDPDTLRFQFHSQKTGLSLDTAANLDLYYQMYEWLGTRYRFGGESKKGIDCSGFTGVIYENVYKRTLPRDSRSMYKMTRPISKEEMKEGDLVFFRIRRGQVSHVGIYLGDNKFVHSSTSSGVIVSDLREDYYRRYFYKAGRLKSPTEVVEDVRD